jgi:predicted nicotinamide N-methyase
MVLDIGAGAGIVSQMNFKGLARRIHGIDPDPRVLENPYLNQASIGNAEHIPHEDKSGSSPKRVGSFS